MLIYFSFDQLNISGMNILKILNASYLLTLFEHFTLIVHLVYTRCVCFRSDGSCCVVACKTGC